MLIQLLLAAAQALAAPQPGELQTFQDWTVGCDNGGACQAVALADLSDDPVQRMPMSIRREAGGDADPLVSIQLPEGESAAFSVDGRRLPIRLMPLNGALVVHPADLPALVAVIRSAQELRVVDTGGRPIGTVSLAGATAALRWMDEAQGRIGTVTALTDRGERPATTVPAPRPLPEVRLPPETQASPIELDAARIRRVRQQVNCSVDEVGGPDEHSTVALDERRTLVMLACGTGAYNLAIVPMIAERRGNDIAVTPALFDLAELNEDGQSLTNAEYHHGERMITTFYRGRGIGDCGERSHYAWDGQRLRLVMREIMTECRGATDFITTWRAQVVRP